jgi:hypothetical protein
MCSVPAKSPALRAAGKELFKPRPLPRPRPRPRVLSGVFGSERPFGSGTVAVGGANLAGGVNETVLEGDSVKKVDI